MFNFIFLFQQETVGQITFSILFEYGFLFRQDLFFELDLRRAAVLEDTFEQLATAHHTDYMMPLVVNV